MNIKLDVRNNKLVNYKWIYHLVNDTSVSLDVLNELESQIHNNINDGKLQNIGETKDILSSIGRKKVKINLQNQKEQLLASKVNQDSIQSKPKVKTMMPNNTAISGNRGTVGLGLIIAALVVAIVMVSLLAAVNLK